MGSKAMSAQPDAIFGLHSANNSTKEGKRPYFDVCLLPNTTLRPAPLDTEIVQSTQLIQSLTEYDRNRKVKTANELPKQWKEADGGQDLHPAQHTYNKRSGERNELPQYYKSLPHGTAPQCQCSSQMMVIGGKRIVDSNRYATDPGQTSESSDGEKSSDGEIDEEGWIMPLPQKPKRPPPTPYYKPRVSHNIRKVYGNVGRWLDTRYCPAIEPCGTCRDHKAGFQCYRWDPQSSRRSCVRCYLGNRKCDFVANAKGSAEGGGLAMSPSAYPRSDSRLHEARKGQKRKRQQPMHFPQQKRPRRGFYDCERETSNEILDISRWNVIDDRGKERTPADMVSRGTVNPITPLIKFASTDPAILECGKQSLSNWVDAVVHAWKRAEDIMPADNLNHQERQHSTIEPKELVWSDDSEALVETSLDELYNEVLHGSSPSWSDELNHELKGDEIADVE